MEIEIKTHYALLGYFPVCRRAQRPGNYSTAHAVRGAAFKAVPETDVCAYCAKYFLTLRNSQRKNKGLPPVLTYNA